VAVAFIGVPESDESLRRCIWCNLLQPLSAFAFRSTALATRQSHCRTCHGAYRKSHYLRTRPEYVAREVDRVRRRRAENRRLLRAYLRSHTCVDCGETDIVTLQFDHRDRDQTSRRWPAGDWEALDGCVDRNREVRCSLRELSSQAHRFTVWLAPDGSHPHESGPSNPDHERIAV
jgi:hypothetical protein